jgi:predicted transglutaminase-like cysteine proteinase
MSTRLQAIRSTDFAASLWRTALLGLSLASAILISELPRVAVDPAIIGLLTAESVGLAADQNASATPGEKSAEPFGMGSEPVQGGSLTEKWRRAETGISRSRETVAQCRADHACPAPAQRLIGLSQEGAGRSGRAQVGLINRAVDLAIKPVSDERQWGIADRWSDPFETLLSEHGDCEDYAILKYTALLEAGFPKEALKIIVWKDRWPDEDHAVLAVRVDNQWLILDNRNLTLVRDTDVRRATPQFVLDERGVRRLVSNDRARKMPS